MITAETREWLTVKGKDVMKPITYRGYEITAKDLNVPHSLAKHDYRIAKNGDHVCSQPSLDFARHWIDEQLEQ